MPGQLLPPPEFDHPLPEETTHAERLAAWVDIMNAAEVFLMAGLRREIGPKGDLRAAYRKWYEDTMDDHDQMMRRLVDEFNRRIADHAG